MHSGFNLRLIDIEILCKSQIILHLQQEDNDCNQPNNYQLHYIKNYKTEINPEGISIIVDITSGYWTCIRLLKSDVIHYIEQYFQTLEKNNTMSYLSREQWASRCIKLF